MNKVAIVILNWNGADMLRRYLPSVIDHSKDETVVCVADNASQDDSVQMLKSHFPECRLIELSRNWGFADGYNKALSQVEAEYYVLLNSDVEVTAHWLTPLIAFMDSHPTVAACQPKLLSVAHKDMFEYAGASGGFIDGLGYPYCRGRLFDTVEHDLGQYDEAIPVHWATGAALLVRSADYWAVGGLDGRFFAHSEEIDLCWRLRIAGKQIYCLPQSHVYHVGGGTLSKSNPMKTYLNFRNNLTMLYKCLPAERLSRVMRLRWWLDYLAAWQMLLLRGAVADFKAVYRARRDFYAWRSQFDADRTTIQSSRQGQEHGATTQLDLEKAAEYHPFSILWQYYVRRRKTFSQLPIGLSHSNETLHT